MGRGASPADTPMASFGTLGRERSDRHHTQGQGDSTPMVRIGGPIFEKIGGPIFEKKGGPIFEKFLKKLVVRFSNSNSPPPGLVVGRI